MSTVFFSFALVALFVTSEVLAWVNARRAFKKACDDYDKTLDELREQTAIRAEELEHTRRSNVKVGADGERSLYTDDARSKLS